MDQIANHAAKIRFASGGRTPCPVTIRTTVYGGTGNGGTHSQSLETWFMHVPGLKVIVPSTPADAEGLLRAAIFDPDPCVFIDETALHLTKGPRLDTPDKLLPLGKADVKRAGRDVTIITYGRGVRDSLAAADALAADGIEAEVIDLRTLVPLDLPTVLDSVSRTRRAVIVDDGARVSEGDPIYSVATDKVESEIEAPASGVLRHGEAEADVDYAIGTRLGAIET